MKTKTSFMTYDEIISSGLQLSVQITDAEQMPQISRHARFYKPENIIIGPRVRIDDFCLISAPREKVRFEGWNHIAAGVMIFGAAGFDAGTHAQIAAQSIILTESDDFSGEFLNGPTERAEHRQVESYHVSMGPFSILGARSTVFPGVIIGTGAVTGAHTLVRQSLPAWSINVGAPSREVGTRSSNCMMFAL